MHREDATTVGSSGVEAEDSGVVDGEITTDGLMKLLGKSNLCLCRDYYNGS